METRIGVGSSDQIDDYIECSTVSPLFSIFGGRRTGNDEATFESMHFRAFQLVGGPCGSKRSRAHGSRQLDCCESYPAACGVDKDALTGPKSSLDPESIVSGDEGFRNRGRFLKRELWWDCCQGAFVNGNVFCVCAASSKPQNAIAIFPELNCRTNRFDLACELQSGNVGGDS